VPGIADVFRATFVDHRYPPHTHDTWAVILVHHHWDAIRQGLACSRLTWPTTGVLSPRRSPEGVSCTRGRAWSRPHWLAAAWTGRTSRMNADRGRCPACTAAEPGAAPAPTQVGQGATMIAPTTNAGTWVMASRLGARYGGEGRSGHGRDGTAPFR
jgi:hypothetical protein